MTGAAILVALIVLLVPELLSHPQHVRVPQVAAADEAPIRSYRMSLGDSQQSAMPVTPVAPTGPGTSGAPVSPGAPAKAVTPARAVTSDTARSASPPGDAPARVAGSAEPAPRVPRARAESAERGDKAAHAESAAGGWAVQVGSFGSRENADRLAHSLKLKGYGAFVTESSSQGRKWYRVRVGPQRSRAAADAIATRLRATGLRGAVAQAR